MLALNEQIHQFHDGVSRELYKIYVLGDAQWSVVSALAREVVRESEADPALVERLRSQIDSAREAARADQ